MSHTYIPFDPADPMHIAAVAGIWTAACGPTLAITADFVRFVASPGQGVTSAGRMAMEGDTPVGFALVSVMTGSPDVTTPEVGNIEAVAVAPGRQGRGVGCGLLDWAEGWLAGQGCKAFRLGGGLQWVIPGLPVALEQSAGYFTRHGYAGDAGHERSWDVARSLADYATPQGVRVAKEVRVAPLEAGQEDALLAFLYREFPNRWRYELEEYLRRGARLSDYTVLWSERGVDGFARLTFEDSVWPLGRYFLNGLPHPWGQLGPIGVSADRRGLGYGGAMLDGGLRRLHEAGVQGCVIDWTGIVDFYGKFGFRPYREYLMWHKAQAA
jgi:predicted N-acetyltransferase YhbS